MLNRQWMFAAALALLVFVSFAQAEEAEAEVEAATEEVAAEVEAAAEEAAETVEAVEAEAEAESETQAIEVEPQAEAGVSLDDMSYTIGYMMAFNLQSQGISEISSERFIAGVEAALAGGEPELSRETMQAAAMELQMRAQAQQAQRMQEAQAVEATNIVAGEAFLAENSVKEGVVTTESGLQYKIIEAGEGESPAADDIVTVHYEGTLLDGTVFDSSYARDEPLVWDPSQFGLIPGWVEGLRLMKPGSTYEFYIPADLAYGSRGQGEIQPGSTLVFKVELLKVEAPAQ